MKQILSLFTVLFCLNYCFSQNKISLQGRIIDGTTNNPISFATIYYKYGGTIADESGFFRITDARLTDTLRVSCIGFKNKYVLASGLKTNGVNLISMDKHIAILTEVKVNAKRKQLGSIQIIRNALDRIQHNYPNDPILYHGYYREYLMQSDNYFNLLETIIDIEDQGFGSPDKFNAQILFKKQNSNFEMKESVLIPYDNELLKIVPDAKMPELCNELLLLRLHDPIRRSNNLALSYIDTLQTNFIRNHHFKKPEIVYLDNKPIYLIQFKNAYVINGKEPTLSINGEIYIDYENWGIHKIIYTAFSNNGKPDNKVYELNLSYKQIRDQYYLHYISFNNIFKREYPEKMFKINSVLIDKRIIIIEIILSNSINPSKNNPENTNKYTLKLNDHKFKIDEVRLKDSVIKIYSKEFAKIIDTITMECANNVSVDIENIYDITGSKINERHFETYYQYREFFVKNSREEFKAMDKTKLYDPYLPMLKNQVYFQNYSDTTWINTPLIK